LNRLLAFVALIGCAFAVSAAAQVSPEPGIGDPRIQTVMYDPNQVVLLRVPTGYQLTLELAQDERIENVAVGDSGAWQVTPNRRGDRLFIKPIQPNVTTNLTVVTDARTYIFQLSPGSAYSSPYTVRFQYPAAPTPTQPTATADEPGRYRLAGDMDLRPDAISDDGSKTYIMWRPEQTLPAVFVVGRDGQEALADGAMRDGRYVLDSVNDKLVFRLDKKNATAVRVPAVKR
jgi:type IV secretion system protein VirB9